MNPILLIAACGFAALIGGQLISEPPPTFEIETFDSPNSGGHSIEFEAPLNSSEDATSDNIFEAPGTVPNETGNDHSSGQRPILEFSPISLLAALHPEMLLSPRQSQSKTQEPNKPANDGAADQRRLVSIIGGTVKLDVAQWPIVGSQKAKYVFVEMFDYACPHCRKTHATIKGAAAKLNDDLATIVLPVPLNTACNSSVRNTDPKFIESCEVAKLAVAVWRTDPSKFSDFHNWMFTGESSPTYASAKAHAETLVSPEKLATELNSELPGKYIAKNVELYRRSGAGNVPKLMFPGTSIVGEFTSIDALVNVIVRENK